ncbi:hypothetical protein F5Y16DRAFT_218879 [Xylariaceae sp. FL0255]|nr:hypothetical protein F5Y16DRAFT_218879 [Xylariaceae sp. FL0255]
MTPREPLLAAVDAIQEGRSSRRRPSVALTASDTMSGSRRSSIVGGLRVGFGVIPVARRSLGISLLLVTVFLWTASNFLASSIFSDTTYNKPFFLVYFNTSLFAASVIPIAIRQIRRVGGLEPFKNEAIQAWREYRKGVQVGGSRVKSGNVNGRGGRNHENDLGERLLADEEEEYDDTFDGNNLEDADGESSDKLSFFETARLSLEFALIWFLGNYFASAGLEYTSVASVTILTSTSSIWTLIFCALVKIEPFSLKKLAGVLASLTGVVMISLVDLSGTSGNDDSRGDFPHKSQGQIAVGDAMAFFSAVIYGLYVVVMKIRVGNESRVNMPLFFGLVGMFNIVLLWPLFPILHYTGIEPFEPPPTGKIWAIIILNSLSSFLSDISWAYALLLTTPLVVTVGLSLTIPLSLIGEMIQYNQYSSFVYWIGALVVVFSFLFINHESRDADGVLSTDEQP